MASLAHASYVGSIDAQQHFNASFQGHPPGKGVSQFVAAVHPPSSPFSAGSYDTSVYGSVHANNTQSQVDATPAAYPQQWQQNNPNSSHAVGKSGRPPVSTGSQGSELHPESAAPPLDYPLLLISLAEDYFLAADSQRTSGVLSPQEPEIKSYYKFIATGLGCLEVVLKASS